MTSAPRSNQPEPRYVVYGGLPTGSEPRKVRHFVVVAVEDESWSQA